MSPRPAAFSPAFACGWLRRLPILAVGLLGLGAMSAGVADAEPAGPTVAVDGGTIRGRALPDGGAVFRGVPFAAPPVGELRWREPQPVVPWSGVRDAREPGPAPAQASVGWNAKMADAGREDCLYLDVWTPAFRPAAKLPVMVWIHGGANFGLQGGREPIYEGGALITHGVVLVVIEYRLGVFGFMAHPALTRESAHHASGNYALLDQLAALRWVQNNIRQVGGDPDNVTVFGQSAGGWDIAALMASPLSRGLFHRAILQSGVPSDGLTVPLAQAEQAGVAVAESLGIHDGDTLAALRAIPAARLAAAAPTMNAFCRDGWVLPRPPLAVWRAGEEAKVDLLIGSNTVEFPSPNAAAAEAAIRDFFGPLAPRALALYGLAGAPPLAVDPVYGDALEQWGSDIGFRIPGILHGEWHRAAGNRVWQYEFGRPVAPHARAQHSSELPFVFGNFRESDGMVTGRFDATDRRLSGFIQRYWTNFARAGDPNGTELVRWPAYDLRERGYLVFSATGEIHVAHDPRGRFADLFRDWFAQAGKTGP